MSLYLFRYLLGNSDMSAFCSAYGCRSVLPCYTQIGKCCYHMTGLVKGNIHNCLLLCRFESSYLFSDGLPVTARAWTWWYGMCTELHVKLSGCGSIQPVAGWPDGCCCADEDTCWPIWELLAETHLVFSCPDKFFIIACLVWYLTWLVNALSSRSFNGLLFCHVF